MDIIKMTEAEYWANENRRTELYHQALDEIEAEMGGYYPDYYRRVNVRHQELCDKEGVIMFGGLTIARDCPIYMEDRETRFAEGEERWQPQ